MRYFIVITLLTLFSCGQSTERKAQLENSTLESKKNIGSQIVSNETQVDSLISNKNDSVPEKGISIKFDEFHLLIDHIEAWDESENLNKIQSDTVKVDLEIGEILGENSMRIINCSYDQINIYQRFENSITIMNEGPHCDMLDWKHFTSKWKKVEKLDNLNYKANLITAEQMEKFISVDLDEFKKCVKDHCGEEWAELVKDVKSVNEYPCGVGTSKIELKIILSNSESNISVEKVIEFDIAMGC